MKIKNASGLSSAELQLEVSKGGKIVHYPFTISLLVVTLNRNSEAYLVRNGENAAKKGLGFTLLSALFGWWGIPKGPKLTMKNIRTNLRGGKNVTEEVIAILAGHDLFREIEKEKTSLH